MAEVTFTLDEFRKIVREETEEVFDRKFDEKFAEKFDEKFGPAFTAAFDPYARAIQRDFMKVNSRLDGLEADMSEVKSDVKELKRLVGQHSKDITELRSRFA